MQNLVNGKLKHITLHAPVYHCIPGYSSVPLYTGVLQSTTVYWGTPVYHSILGYSSVPQYITSIPQYTGVQCTPVYHSILGHHTGALQCHSILGYTSIPEVLQSLPVAQTNYVWYTLSLSLNNLLLSKVSVELHFEHSYDITPALFAGKAERAVY